MWHVREEYFEYFFCVQNVLGFIREGFCMMTIAFSVWEFFTKFSSAFSTGKLDIIEANSLQSDIAEFTSSKRLPRQQF